jgi:2-polyprenyl-6-methoxyphenol hydroxylase-like FAD-dependent oxidoreductase
MIDVVIAGAGPNGLMLACELGLAGIQPVVLDPMPGPNPHPRVNRIVGQGVRILDHRGLYSQLTGTAEPPQPAPRSMFAGFALDLAVVPQPYKFTSEWVQLWPASAITVSVRAAASCTVLQDLPCPSTFSAHAGTSTD